KTKWYKLILFIAAFICSLFLLQWLFDFGIKHNLNIKSSYVSSHKTNIDILVLGPCEPLWMVAPEIISKKTNLSCYNLANSHSDFADNYLHLHLYLKNNVSPSYLLLFVTPESFDVNYNTFYSYRFASFLNDTVVANTVKTCDANYYTWRNYPFMKYAYYSHQMFFSVIQGCKHYFTKKTQPYYADGFEPPAKIVWDNHYDNLKKKYPKGYYFTLDSLREKYLYKILGLCKEKNIKVIMYESPILKETSTNQPNREDFLVQINNVAKNVGVPFISFQKLSLVEDRKNFISPMVTTLQGSYMFSDTLGGYLHSLLKQ
ncbi:MAG TPA: hypothetical protein VF411_14640, partial [Bacteroidia bacterium]